MLRTERDKLLVLIEAIERVGCGYGQGVASAHSKAFRRTPVERRLSQYTSANTVYGGSLTALSHLSQYTSANTVAFEKAFAKVDTDNR